MSTQTLAINCTYDPCLDDFSCDKSSVTVNKFDTGVITIGLYVTTPSDGKISFDNPPITWGSAGSPPGSSVSPSTGGTSSIVITDPNTAPAKTNASYPFDLNWTYQGNDKTARGSHDPTIINEGTSNVPRPRSSRKVA